MPIDCCQSLSRPLAILLLALIGMLAAGAGTPIASSRAATTLEGLISEAFQNV